MAVVESKLLCVAAQSLLAVALLKHSRDEVDEMPAGPARHVWRMNKQAVSNSRKAQEFVEYILKLQNIV